MSEVPVDAIDELHRMALEKEWWRPGQEPDAWKRVGRWLDLVKPDNFYRNTGETRKVNV